MRVVLPSSVREACAALNEHIDRNQPPVPFAGGTDLMVHWGSRVDHQTRCFVDLSGLVELQGIRWTKADLHIGALTTFWQTLTDERIASEFPILCAAARTVGAIQIQSRGTWAGNIVNASPAADGVPALMALDAAVVMTNGTTERETPLDEFYFGYKKIDLRPGELIKAVRVPRRGAAFWAFEKVGARRAQAITKVGAAVVKLADAPQGSSWRIVVNSVAPTVCRCRSVEGLVSGSGGVLQRRNLRNALQADTSPIDDIRSTAAYRQEALARVLTDILERAGIAVS